MQIKPLPPKEDQLIEGDVKIRQHLPTLLLMRVDLVANE